MNIMVVIWGVAITATVATLALALASPGANIVIGAAALAVILAIYFLPTLVAARGHKRNTAAIFLLNLLLGWTLLGWIGALVWAAMHEASLPATD